jgi:hypothetical protein
MPQQFGVVCLFLSGNGHDDSEGNKNRGDQQTMVMHHDGFLVGVPALTGASL